MTSAVPWIWTYGYDYLARVWLDGPFRVHEDALEVWLDGVARCDIGLSGDIADPVGPMHSLENLKRVLMGEHMLAWVPLYVEELGEVERNPLP